MVKFVTASRAFTLLEVVIYLALFSVLMTVVVRTVYSLLETSHAADSALEIQHDGSFVLEKITWALGDSELITIDGTSTLDVIRSDDHANSVRFSVVNGRWYLTRGSADPTPLSSAHHQVHDVSIQLTHPIPESDYLHIRFSIDDVPFSLVWTSL